jgi:hypothetical protein
MPMTEGFVPSASSPYFSADIDIWVCDNCGLAQTRQNACDALYYRDYGYSASNTKIGTKWFNAVADLLTTQYGIREGSLVLDAGSSDGGQLKAFKARRCMVFGFEPSAALRNAALKSGIQTSPQLFCKSALAEIPIGLGQAQAIISSFTFDHASDPLAFLATAHQVIDKRKGILALEVHNLTEIIRINEWCLFQHEHTAYYTIKTLSDILHRGGFNIVDVNPLAGARSNSLFVIARPVESGGATIPIPDKPIDWHMATTAIMRSRKRAQQFVQESRLNGMRVAGYGAGARGVATLATIAEPGDFEYVADDNASYRNLLTPKSLTPIVDPSRFSTDRVDQVIVFSYGYFDEIYRRLFREMGYGGDQIIPLTKIL